LISGKTIFISPLDWGLGHATRCIPIIRKLEKENKIILGVTPLTKDVFEDTFPHIKKINVPSYNIRYSSVLPLWLKLLFAWPGISKVIRKENRLISRIIQEHKIDILISDNRFGLFSKDAYTIFITHQVFLKAPFAAGIAQSINSNYIMRFDEVWIPDYESNAENLSGELSHGRHFHNKIKYIGPQSAMSDLTLKSSTAEPIDFLVLLSGVEPQRSILEKELLERFKGSPQNIVLVRGSKEGPKPITSHIKIIDFASGEVLKQLIVNATTVVCRSGYSTLMDLHILGKKKLILIPTPGQTEQEYLACYWKKKFSTVCLEQENINVFHFS